MDRYIGIIDTAVLANAVSLTPLSNRNCRTPCEFEAIFEKALTHTSGALGRKLFPEKNHENLVSGPFKNIKLPYMIIQYIHIQYVS
jgi:hypothetical protein